MSRDGILITLLNGYGDAFLALPCFREISRRFGSERVYLVCQEDHISAFFTDLSFTCLPIPAGKSTVPDSDLFSLPIHEVISLNAYLCEIDRQVGEVFADARWRGFCDRVGKLVVRPSVLVNKHKRDQYYEALGWTPVYEPMDRRVTLSQVRIESITAFCREGCHPVGERFYTLHLDTQDEKMWPTQCWLTVVLHIWNRWHAWPLIVGKPTSTSDAIIDAFPFVRTLFSYSDIRDHFAAISVGRAFLGIDSVFAHIADSLQIPSVVLFGFFDLRVWGPVSSTSVAIQMEGNRPLQELSPLDAIERIDVTLSQAFG